MLQLHVFNHHERIERVRDHIRDIYSELYDGWDHDFDRKHDAQTIWFVIDDGPKLCQATGRFVFWDTANEVHRPLSINLAKGTWSVGTDQRIAVEGAGLTCASKKCLYSLILAMFEWLNTKDIQDCHSVFDETNSRIADLNTNEMNFVRIPNATMKFDTFKHKEKLKGGPVVWQIARQNKQQRSASIEKLKSKGVRLLSDEHRAIPIPV